MKTDWDTAVIGGGAAGFFAAVHAAQGGRFRTVILEKSAKLLAKVRISGGGRCNVTHDCDYPSQLVKHYPRGGKKLKKAFERFGTQDTRLWFESRGVKLKTEADGRVFPVTDSSETVIDCLMRAARACNTEIRLRAEVTSVQRDEEGIFHVETTDGAHLSCRKLIVCAGGSPKNEAYGFIRDLGIRIIPPVPSLFTFNVPDFDLTDLAGIASPNASVQIPGSGYKSSGPLLITHRGFSAPAVIKLSALAALELHARKYRFPILIDWTGCGEEGARAYLAAMREQHPRKKTVSNPGFDLPARLWERLCTKAGIAPETRTGDLPAKCANRLTEMLVRCPYDVAGKNAFKEEFVTCGGADLNEVETGSFESRKIPGLYFAGEFLNVDGLTGGFNFQHAWTSGFLAGSHAAAALTEAASGAE